MNSELPPQQSRDLRIDCLRGIALLVITSNHIMGNPFRQVTPAAWGLADMAEVFLFLSGYVCGLSALKFRENAVGLFLKFWKRSAQLFVAYIITGLVILFLVRENHLSGHIESISPNLLSGSFSQVLSDLLLVNGRMSHLCILLLYIVLLFALPLLLILFRFRPVPLLIFSVAVYECTQFLDWRLPAQLHHAIAFNALAWQLIFVIGTAFALRHPETIPKRRNIVISALIGFFILISLSTGTSLLSYWAVSKPQLGPLRVIHFLLSAIIVHALLPDKLSEQTHRWLSPIILCGQQSLATYCGGAMLSVVILPWLPIDASLGWWIVTNIVIWCGCVAIAWGAKSLKSRFQSLLAQRVSE